jgi:hypothetical protein
VALRRRIAATRWRRLRSRQSRFARPIGNLTP